MKQLELPLDWVSRLLNVRVELDLMERWRRVRLIRNERRKLWRGEAR